MALATGVYLVLHFGSWRIHVDAVDGAGEGEQGRARENGVDWARERGIWWMVSTFESFDVTDTQHSCFSGIWSMHFVSMLALDLGIPVAYNIPVTILSAVVAITATFTTFGYELICHYIRKFRRIAELNRMLRPILPSESQQLLVPPPLDPTSGLEERDSYDTVSPKSNASVDLPPISHPIGMGTPSRRRWTGLNHSDENIIEYRMNGHAHRHDPIDDVNVTTTTMLKPDRPNDNHTGLGLNADPGRGASVVHFEQPMFNMGYPADAPSLFPFGLQREGAITPPSSDSLNPDPFSFERSSNGSFSSETMAMLYGPGLGQSWKGDDDLSVEGSRRASIVLLAKVVATRFTYKVVVKGVLMGLAVVSMHYTGMGAMRMEGTIVWNWWLVALSVVDACLVCMIAIIFSKSSNTGLAWILMLRCSASIAIQLYQSNPVLTGIRLRGLQVTLYPRDITLPTISLTIAIHVSMHYCGMFAANFHTVLAPEERHAGNIQSHTLPWSIAVIAFASCLISYVLLAHTVTSSRDELVEAIRTKRALWRTMAEKEAAVRSDKMKMDFISVASHEIRVSSACFLVTTDSFGVSDSSACHCRLRRPPRANRIDTRTAGIHCRASQRLRQHPPDHLGRSRFRKAPESKC